MPQQGWDTAGAGEGFRETLAQWRLDLRTEVKKCSSLPTAMFDACDPMLETRLAETARVMLARLQGPESRSVVVDSAASEMRLERVTADDLEKLPQQIAAVPPSPLDIEQGLLPEYLGILTDTCCLATGAAQDGATELLQRDFGLSATTDITTLTELLTRQVRQAPELFAAATRFSDDALALACQRVAAAMVLQVQARDGSAPEGSP